jgi:membrane-bound ClpP family serine protease
MTQLCPPALAAAADVRTYVLPIRGVMGLDFDAALASAIAEDLAKARPEFVVIEIDSGLPSGMEVDFAVDPRRESACITELRDCVDLLQEALGGIPAAVLVRQANGPEAIVALGWSRVYMDPAARIGCDHAVDAGSGKDADIKAKMWAAWKGIGAGIAAQGGHDRTQFDAVIASGATGGLDSSAASAARICSGTASGIEQVASACGHSKITLVGRADEISRASMSEWRQEFKAASKLLASFQEPIEAEVDLASRRKLLVSVQEMMSDSPRLERALEWSRGFNLEAAADLLKKLDAAATGKQDPQGYSVAANGLRVSPKKGVFLLPWRGGVGQTACAAEIEAVAAAADKWGPGQIIVLEIDSPGGLVTEVFKVIDTIAKVRERHRVVAWVREAMSAAAVSAMACDEIYFRRDGVLGAAMVIRGADSPYGGALDKFRDEIGAAIEKNGRPRAVFDAMVLAKPVLTYTKDSASGKTTFHDRITGLPGEVVLSDEKDNLTFNAGNALACGFSKGTASSGEELAPLLGLKEWHEVSDFGVKLASASRMVFEACEQDFEQLQAILAGGPADASPAGLRAQALALEKVLAWNTLCPPCIAGRIGDTGVEQVRRALADLRPKLVEPAKAGD